VPVDVLEREEHVVGGLVDCDGMGMREVPERKGPRMPDAEQVIPVMFYDI
jgi:hypothetical protein